jgi:hypothetical protein
MCKYSYSNGKCANIDIHAHFCIGEKNCSLSDILRNRYYKEHSEDGPWQFVPLKIWNIGKYNE